MISFRNKAVCRYKYFKNSKKRIIIKKAYTIDTKEKNIAMKNLIITETLKEFFYRSKIIFKNKEKAKN